MRHLLKLVIVVVLLAWVSSPAQTDPPAEVDSVEVAEVTPPGPVTSLSVTDKDNDHGHATVLSWEASVDDSTGLANVISYEIFRWVPFAMDHVDSLRGQLSGLRAEIAAAEDVTDEMETRLDLLEAAFDAAIDNLPQAHGQYPQNGEWRSVGVVASGVTAYGNTGTKEPTSADYIPDYADLYYRVDAVTADPVVRTASEVYGPVQCYGQWFNTDRSPVLVAVLAFGFFTLLFVTLAKKGTDLYVRPLAGIEAVDDAIGRATEMGRPILYVLGLGSAADVATIASFTILGRVAKRVAEYQTALIVPTYEPIVMTVAQEVVKSSYLDAGRPDDFKEDTVFFVTQSQFAYVAAVNGIMLRELPATCIYMGKFFAESLILAETGALAGSIQIAGTDEIAQIPFFIVACDYTLIGEELYAASAYLGREPILLGSLKAQDYAKALVVAFSVIGLIFANLEWTWFVDLFHVAN